jgi:hypothetical protein
MVQPAREMKCLTVEKRHACKYVQSEVSFTTIAMLISPMVGNDLREYGIYR